MEYFLWGVNPQNIRLKNNIEKSGCKILYFIDSKASHKKLLGNECEVISPDEFIEKFNSKESCIFLTIRSSKTYYAILEKLKNTVCDIGIILPRAFELDMPVNIATSENIIWKRKSGIDHTVVPWIETNLADGCNLKCQGCTHFSSIFSEDSFYDFDKFSKDMHQLRKVSENLLILRLLGGEPFLLRNIDKYTSLSRNLFPESNIEIVSNGLLIPELDDKILKNLSDNNIIVLLSPYYPTLKKREEIEIKLQKNNVRFSFLGSQPVNIFIRNLTLNNHNNGKISQIRCHSTIGCTFFRNGKVYKCAFEGLIKEFGEYYNLSFDTGNGVDIYDESFNIEEKIRELIVSPVKMCNYCSEKIEIIQWKILKDPKIEDWLYINGMH